MTNYDRADLKLKPHKRYAWYALGILFTVYTFNVVDRQLLSILVEPIKGDLGLTDTEIGFLTGLAFLSVYTIAAIPIGHFADHKNRTGLITLCSAVWSVMTAVTGMATGFLGLVATRLGVGVSEAGLTPAAYSLIGDLFDSRDRGKAIGIYMTAGPCGVILAGLAVAWLAGTWGWRVAFFTLGGAGLILTVLFASTFKEPVRSKPSNLEFAATGERPPPVREIFRSLMKRRSCRYLFAGFMFKFLVSSAIGVWMPAYFMRFHGLSLVQMSGTVVVILGVGASFGTILGGWMTDKFLSKDSAGYLGVPAGTVLLTIPLYVVAFNVHSTWLSVSLLAITMALDSTTQPPVLTYLQRLTGGNSRAITLAIFFLAIELIGGGFGPLLVGQLSDTFAASGGLASLRFALLSTLPLLLLGAFLLWRGSYHVRRDLEWGPV